MLRGIMTISTLYKSQTFCKRILAFFFGNKKSSLRMIFKTNFKNELSGNFDAGGFYFMDQRIRGIFKFGHGKAMRFYARINIHS